MNPEHVELKPITIVVPLGAGSSVDIAARVVGAELANRQERLVEIELMPGAGGTIGTAHAARAAPDGDTLVICSNGTFAINMGLYANPGYDPNRDFTPVALLGAVTNVMVVHPRNPANSAREVIAAAQAQPGRLTYSSGGTGTTHHFCGAMFAAAAGVNLTHFPFDASADAIQQVIDERVSIGLFNLPTVLGHIQAGRLKALAVTGRQRSGHLPLLPTLESVLGKPFDVTAWFGLAAPAGTPEALIETLNAGIGRALAVPAVRTRLIAQGFEIAAHAPPVAFAQLIARDLCKWAALIRQAGIPFQ